MNRIIMRYANENDLPLMMAWRSNPLIYKGFYSQDRPLFWDEHLAWWNSRTSEWRSFLFYYEMRPVGVVNIGQLSHWSPEIGYYLGEIGLWGKGLCTEAVAEGIKWLKEVYAPSHSHITHVHTTIKDDNIASIKLIEKLGFNQGMKAREGESYWVRKL